MLACCEFSFGPDIINIITIAFCEFSFGPDIIITRDIIIIITDPPGAAKKTQKDCIAAIKEAEKSKKAGDKVRGGREKYGTSQIICVLQNLGDEKILEHVFGGLVRGCTKADFCK